MPAKTPLAGDKIDAPAACAVPFHPYCAGVVTRTRNVSEYMLILALCLVTSVLMTFRVSRRQREMYIGHARLCVCLSLAARPHYCTDPDVTCIIGRICNWCMGFVAMTT